MTKYKKISYTMFIVFQTLNPKWNEEILFRVSMYLTSVKQKKKFSQQVRMMSYHL